MTIDSGGTTRQEQSLLRHHAERYEQRRTDRWRGLHRHHGAAAFLRWYFEDQDRQESPRALSMERNGGGPPSVESLEALYRDRAAGAAALKAAELDDRERHPTDPWPLGRLLHAAYHGQGRVRGYSDAQIAERTGKGEVEVQGRRARALRVVRDHLKADGVLDCGREEAGEP